MAFSYIGGKSKIGPSLIIPNIPTDIETYVEPFSGAYWVYFKMDINDYPNLKTIVYNDYNKLNYNLFNCMRTPELLLEECEKLTYQKKGESPTPPECSQTFYDAQKELFAEGFEPGIMDYESAAKYVYLLTNVFSGGNPIKSKFIDLKGKYHSKYFSFMNKLKDPKWIEKFKKITFVENMDFEDVIKKYDSPTTYFYADPPYYKTETYYANHEFGIETHQRLANCLKSIKGRFSLSYYDFPQLSEWFPKDEYVWKSKAFNKAAMAKAGEKQSVGVELLIMNYSINEPKKVEEKEESEI